jgi:hypothetical protein
VFKLAIFQVVSPFFLGGAIHELFPEFDFVNLDLAGSVLAFSILDLLRCSGLVMLHIHRNDTVGQFNPEAVLKRWDSSGNRKIHLAITDCHLKLFIKLLL